MHSLISILPPPPLYVPCKDDDGGEAEGGDADGGEADGALLTPTRTLLPFRALTAYEGGGFSHPNPQIRIILSLCCHPSPPLPPPLLLWILPCPIAWSSITFPLLLLPLRLLLPLPSSSSPANLPEISAMTNSPLRSSSSHLLCSV